ncbi:MAG: zinc ABC transporter substrate-binding protein [Opitutaceae bacterium]|nr:zinc ABC transporter substrate-binding protein [Opitutaceae bacterium]
MRCLLFVLLFAATSLGFSAEPAARPPVVVTANTILDDLVRQLGGDQVSTRCLIQPGADPHSFEPRPSDVKHLVAADLLVVNGLDLEPAILKLAANCGFRGTTVVASAGITPRSGACEHADHAPLGTPCSNSACAHHDHEAEAKVHKTDQSNPSDQSDLHAPRSSLPSTCATSAQSKIGNPKSKIASATPQSADPHAWQDPRNVALYVANIRDALTLANPAAASEYQARATAYLAELSELDHWAREQIATIPATRRKLVTSHDSLGYFAAAYDLEPVPVSGLSTAAEANARDVAAIIDLIRHEQVPAVFFEVTSNPKLVRQIGADAGVRLAEPLFTDSLGAPGSDTATYLTAMRSNVSRIVAALSP